MALEGLNATLAHLDATLQQFHGLHSDMMKAGSRLMGADMRVEFGDGVGGLKNAKDAEHTPAPATKAKMPLSPIPEADVEYEDDSEKVVQRATPVLCPQRRDLDWGDCEESETDAPDEFSTSRCSSSASSSVEIDASSRTAPQHEGADDLDLVQVSIGRDAFGNGVLLLDKVNHHVAGDSDEGGDSTVGRENTQLNSSIPFVSSGDESDKLATVLPWDPRGVAVEPELHANAEAEEQAFADMFALVAAGSGSGRSLPRPASGGVGAACVSASLPAAFVDVCARAILRECVQYGVAIRRVDDHTGCGVFCDRAEGIKKGAVLFPYKGRILCKKLPSNTPLRRQIEAARELHTNRAPANGILIFDEKTVTPVRTDRAYRYRMQLDRYHEMDGGTGGAEPFAACLAAYCNSSRDESAATSENMVPVLDHTRGLGFRAVTFVARHAISFGEELRWNYAFAEGHVPVPPVLADARIVGDPIFQRLQDILAAQT
mmetsp:Transcript_14015/g.34695  ORF Transcript_14015/g.34695 Transcript_14015/m.34695 type:complete len:488 (+) Transcript_14015:138-1601(+)|eukprot:CAMPEP_0178992964 /NCGR_PEP_ID=MMETSP0795-20121207/6422_1 /TAXON_ID=88552 /ORGANISM="Amoebophrya sp., Strain Ameob2" /LENGTH=487 /DNA_ID=CAMNT_0020684935 /DNA_START=69 /DNA_END=1532 /DNA_ORIENTATION=+